MHSYIELDTKYKYIFVTLHLHIVSIMMHIHVLQYFYFSLDLMQPPALYITHFNIVSNIKSFTSTPEKCSYPHEKIR